MSLQLLVLPEAVPCRPLGRNICPACAQRASSGAAQCVEPPVPLVLSAWQGFLGNRSHSSFVGAIGSAEPGVLLVLDLLLPLWSSSR